MRFLVPCVMLVFFAGCCKMYCEDTELTLSFEKFKARDTDTVYFVSYQPKSGLTQVVDTFRILSVIPAADTSRSSVFHYISSQYDWKVIVPSLNREYVLRPLSIVIMNAIVEDLIINPSKASRLMVSGGKGR